MAGVRDVIPKIGKQPLFSLYSAQLDGVAAYVYEPAFAVSDETGRYTEEIQAMWSSRGF